MHVYTFPTSIGNIGKKLTDVSARDMDYQTYTGGPDDDSLSQGSDDSNEELRWRLHNLSREVNNIRSTMGKCFVYTCSLVYLYFSWCVSSTRIFPSDMQYGYQVSWTLIID